ncbi:MAG TPA: hypothetical protein VEQ66_17250 [Propionibacteriaceae bacterium]|nr:hypothetical protein [Propionibacteriaceae bacterium]
MFDRKTAIHRLKMTLLPLAAMAVVGTMAPTSSMAAPSPDVPVAVDTSTTTSIAPVKLKGQKIARGYSSTQIKALDRTGGDPALLDHWTPKRMQQAKPLKAPGDAKVIDKAVRAAIKQLPEVADKPAAPAKASNALKKAPAPVTNFSVTNGKLFFDYYESPSWCSASAINTPSKRVIVTAGHCVHTGKGGRWLTNMVFAPGYNKFAVNRAPRGTFQAYQVRTFNAWTTNSDLNRDVGFVTLYRNAAGQRVVDAIGGHGLVYNGGTEFDASIFGYPSNRDNGDRMWACWGTTQDNSWFDNKSKITCNFGPGASGGPWLANYSNATGLGYVRSVTSTVNSAGVNKGPYFDTAVRDMKNAANNDWPNPA